MRHSWMRHACLLGAALCALATSAGCDGDGPRAITHERVAETPAKPARPDLDEAERLRVAGAHGPGDGHGHAPGDGHDHGPGDGHDPGSGAAAAQGPPQLRWETPAGWQERPAGRMRLASFSLSSEVQAEAYFAVLGGDGGGLAANINRWRQQLGLAALDAEQVAQLPHLEVLGQTATRVDLRGTYTGRDGKARPEFMIAGLMTSLPAGTLGNSPVTFFAKMVGPASVLEPQLQALWDLCASLRIERGPAPTPAPASGSAGQAPAKFDPQALRWGVPEGWELSPKASAMRLVTYQVGESSECYVVVLPGAAGGIAANLNRWRKQMGLEELSPREVESLPSPRLLGVQSTVIEMQGTYSGMSGEGRPDYAFVGLICPLPQHTIFVKMIGPKAEVLPQKPAFQAFCTSFQVP